jgi:molybdopterin-guanine dinucleotide biosynthesis protein A|tara:strand:- start:2495 stop:3094 length:600 start_codon:yes stop_codon:yes gene_type:complete
MGTNKALLQIEGKPLISHVIDALEIIVEDILLVVSKRQSPNEYEKYFGGSNVKIRQDSVETQSPLIGFLTGLSHVSAEYVCVLSCDLPFANPRILERLFRMGVGFDAAIPKWPGGNLEPLYAVYNTARALHATQSSIVAGELSNKDMIKRLRKIRVISTEDLMVDEHPLSFMNVNTPTDLKTARSEMKKGLHDKMKQTN